MSPVRPHLAKASRLETVRKLTLAIKLRYHLLNTEHIQNTDFSKIDNTHQRLRITG